MIDTSKSCWRAKNGGERVGNNNIHFINTNIERSFLPVQIDVLNAIKRWRYILYSGAVRAGKTLLLSNAAIQTCIEYPGAVGMLGSLTTPQLTDVVFRVFKQELSLYQDAFKRQNIPIDIARIKSSKGDMKAIFWNGSEVMFKPCDDEGKLRGLTLDFVGLDEPIDISKDIYNQLMNRISGGHVPNPFILLTTNPGSESHWIWQEFWANGSDEHKVFETTTYDNVLLPDYKRFISSLEANLDEDWIRRFLNGRWGAFSGQIYKNFSPTRHVANCANSKTVKDSISYYMGGLDWGHTHPSCFLTLGITRHKKVYLMDELYQKGMTSRQLANEVHKRYKQYHHKKIYSDASNPDLILQTHDLGVPIEKATRDVQGRIGKIQSLLSKDMLIVDKRCVNTIREMQAYRRKKEKDGTYSEEPVKQDDHAPDALGYGLDDYRLFKGKGMLGFAKRKMWTI